MIFKVKFWVNDDEVFVVLEFIIVSLIDTT